VRTANVGGAVRPRGAQPDASPRKLTSPDKVVFPEVGITKQQVAVYYRAVAPLLLPELVRRPLTLVRCPDGTSGSCFFQKHHADSFGPNVHAVPIREKDGASEDYLYVENLAGVLDLVQMNVLELHLWGSRIEDVERPDRLVFDLDPGPGVEWKDLIAAARDVRSRLQAMGLESFARLSGGKGLHVVLPIRTGPSWDEAKDFCETVADAMTAQLPERYVATASKAKRNGVIFIDWLRNGRGATSVASWSLRARKEAGAAVPVSWTELARTRSGADYPLARAMRRASRVRQDPWHGWVQATRQKLVAPK
jgi:bifunctional non-homologous end joining protein LigD